MTVTVDQNTLSLFSVYPTTYFEVDSNNSVAAGPGPTGFPSGSEPELGSLSRLGHYCYLWVTFSGPRVS